MVLAQLAQNDVRLRRLVLFRIVDVEVVDGHGHAIGHGLPVEVGAHDPAMTADVNRVGNPEKKRDLLAGLEWERCDKKQAEPTDVTGDPRSVPQLDGNRN